MEKFGEETVICTYRVRSGEEQPFLRLLSRHWQTLREHDLVAAQPRLTFVGKDESGATFFVEIFSWKSADAVQIAHELPAVLAAWEPMEQLCEARLGRPAMEFPHVRPIELVAGG